MRDWIYEHWFELILIIALISFGGQLYQAKDKIQELKASESASVRLLTQDLGGMVDMNEQLLQELREAQERSGALQLRLETIQREVENCD